MNQLLETTTRTDSDNPSYSILNQLGDTRKQFNRYLTMSKKIATLWDKKNSDDNNDDHDHQHPDAQAFYAGGSQHSGQQILGPSRDANDPNRLIQNIFDQATAHAEDPNSRPADSEGVTSLPITFWRNGFTVGEDAELRDYESPESRQFLECIKRGDPPPELASQIRGGQVDIRLNSKKHEDYKPTRKAFSGEGHRLGAPAPETETAQPDASQQGAAAASSSSGLTIDDSKPVTTIQVRLVDNSRLVIRANLSHQIGDLVSHIRATRPQYSSANFVLASTFPAKELSDLEQTVEDAKIANSAVLQKMKR